MSIPLTEKLMETLLNAYRKGYRAGMIDGRPTAHEAAVRQQTAVRQQAAVRQQQPPDSQQPTTIPAQCPLCSRVVNIPPAALGQVKCEGCEVLLDLAS